MTVYVALLRAVNVGGTGKLSMEELKSMCVGAGFTGVRTYIASGNVVFTARGDAGEVKSELERRLARYAGKPVMVAVRTAAEMAAIVEAIPFADAAPDRTVAIFLDAPPPADALSRAVGVRDEEMQLGVREIFVHYPSGIGTSKLRIPAAGLGTARNMNTIAKLATMAAMAAGG